MPHEPVLPPRDTTPEAWRHVEDAIRRMTPAERIARAASLTIVSHAFALASIRRQYPGETDREHRLRLARRMYDRALMHTAFGADG